MKNNLILIIILTALVGLSSCAKYIPYTSDIEKKYQITAEEREQLQFKNSKEIILENQDVTVEKEVKKGKLVTKKDSNSNEIVVEEKTFGAVVGQTDNGMLKISFSPDDECYLRFILNPQTKKYEFAVVDSDSKPFVKYCTADGEVKFTVITGTNACLLFSKKDLEKMRKHSKTEKGRKVK